MARKAPVDVAADRAPVTTPTDGGAKPQTELALFVTGQPLLVLTDETVRNALYAEIEREVEAFVPDLTTDMGRKAVASLAYKVTRTKTAIDEAGLSATEEHRLVISRVNEERNKVKARLDELRDKARKPLTDWEALEKKRVETVEAGLHAVRQAGVISISDTTASVVERTAELKVIEFPEAIYLDRLAEVQGARDGSLLALDNAFTRLTQEEADRAHRGKIMGEAKAAIMTCGVDEESARKIVMLIRAGECPHVRIDF